MARFGLDSTRWATVLAVAILAAVVLMVCCDRPARELFLGRPDRGDPGAKWYKTTDPNWWEKW